MPEPHVAMPTPDVARILHDPAFRAFIDAHVSTLVFNAIPDGWEDERHYFEVRVCRRGDGMYAVLNARNDVLSDANEWDYEPLPSARSEKFLRKHRFLLDEAVARAQHIAPHVRLMGKTAAEFVAFEQERRKLHGE